MDATVTNRAIDGVGVNLTYDALGRVTLITNALGAGGGETKANEGIEAGFYDSVSQMKKSVSFVVFVPFCKFPWIHEPLRDDTMRLSAVAYPNGQTTAFSYFGSARTCPRFGFGDMSIVSKNIPRHGGTHLHRGVRIKVNQTKSNHFQIIDGQQMYRAMMQLERVQRMRQGEEIPAPLSMEVSDRRE